MVLLVLYCCIIWEKNGEFRYQTVSIWLKHF